MAKPEGDVCVAWTYIISRLGFASGSWATGRDARALLEPRARDDDSLRPTRSPLVQVALLVNGLGAVYLRDNLIVLEGGYRFFVCMREKGKCRDCLWVKYIYSQATRKP